MKISAIVVTFNEVKYLRQCLASLDFCDQIMVVDLGSTDGSDAIGRELATDFIAHKHVPVVEEIWTEILPQLKFDWVLRADPDEIFPAGLAPVIGKLISEDNGTLSMIKVPYQYHFLGRPLYHSVWGGIRYATKIINRTRVNLYPRVHRGMIAMPGTVEMDIPHDGTNAVRHYWADSFSYLISKHNRYLAAEGKSRYEQGARFQWSSMMQLTFKQFRRSLIKKQGWRGGWTGVFLSLFYGYYEASSWMSLRRFQNQLEKQGCPSGIR